MRSDLSAWHRIDELEAMAAPRFFALALRVAAYPGLVQGLVRREARRRQRIESQAPVSAGQWAAAHPEAMATAAAELSERKGTAHGIQDH